MAATFDQAATQPLEPKKFEALITTTFGTTLDPKNSQSSFTLEPQLAWNLNQKTTLSAYSEIDRPLNPYENFSSPITYLLLTHKVDWVPGTTTTLRFTIRANNLHRWKYDGYQLRSEGGVQLSRDLGNHVNLMGRLWAHGDLNEYRQTTAGKDLPRLGFGERIALSYSPGDFNFELHVIVGQSYHGNSGNRALWKNSIVTAEVAEYRLSDSYTVGFSHELIHSLIDETTGLRGTMKIFDGRASRLSAYMAVSI
ncbi:MAG: hypothetical protein KDD51_07905 [Bdellovibrionales bacterium]|nr:hypothetical protein [Bdellovibrionales bacterium]